MSGPCDPYAVLGVAPTATDDEIRRAYRRRIAADHADLHAGSPAAVAQTQALNAARELLLDPQRRADYDRSQYPLMRPGGDVLHDLLSRLFRDDTPTTAPPVVHQGAVWTGIAVGAMAMAVTVGLAVRGVAWLRSAGQTRR